MIRSSVMFDGRLMVNASFETNVDRVYAAGPAAKFVGGRASDHAAYDSAELGGRVADALTRSLGVREDGGAAGDEYVKPLSVRCRLPGRINYLHAAVPGFGHGDDATATTYRTGDAVDGRYFEMATDGRGDVVAVSCYSKHDFKYLNLIRLCGKNVSLFNNLSGRIENNSIPCLFDYFEEPWAYPLYSDRFEMALNETFKTLRTNYAAKKASADFDRIYKDKLRNIWINFIDENIDDLTAFSYVRDAVNRMDSNLKTY